MFTRVLRVLLIGGLAGCPPASTPDGGPGDAGFGAAMDAGVDAGLSLEQVCAQSASAYVQRLVRCGELTPALAQLYEPLFAQQCPASIPPGVADGRIVLDAAAVQQCLSQARTASCLEEPANCNILRGTVAGGGACFENDECVSGFSCDTSTACPGTCIARVAVGLSPGPGQECVASAYSLGGTCTTLVAANASCAGGLSCAEPNVCSAQNVCAALPLQRALNESCDVGQPCGQGLQCVNDVCVARVTENGACSDVRRCQDGLRCSSTNVCVVVQYGNAGASCAEGGDACKPGLFCELISNTCTPLRSIGGACTDTGGECEPQLYCSMNACKAPGALSAPCVVGGPALQCAESLYCDASGVCADQKPAGAHCVESEECLGFCQGLRCTVPVCRDRTP
jgi:hypothetical protein